MKRNAQFFSALIENITANRQRSVKKSIDRKKSSRKYFGINKTETMRIANDSLSSLDTEILF